jgi:TolA-binding protein
MAKQALDDESTLDDAIKRLEAYLKANADHLGFYEAQSFLGQLYGTKGDYAKAQTAFETFGKAPWKDFQTAAKVAVGRMQLKQNNIDGATKTFADAVTGNATTDTEKARRAEAQVGQAACLVKQSKHDEALKLLDEVIKATSTDEAATMAFAYVLQGDCYQAQNKAKDAALAYLHVPVLFPKEKAAHAEALYHLAKISGTIGQPDRAADARDQLLEDFPKSEWAKKLQAETGAAAPAPAAEKAKE